MRMTWNGSRIGSLISGTLASCGGGLDSNRLLCVSSCIYSGMESRWQSDKRYACSACGGFFIYNACYMCPHMACFSSAIAARGLESAMACFSLATEARGLVSAMPCFSSATETRGLLSAVTCFSSATEARGLVSAMVCFSSATARSKRFSECYGML